LVLHGSGHDSLRIAGTLVDSLSIPNVTNLLLAMAYVNGVDTADIGKVEYTWHERCLVSFRFDIATIIIAFLIDRRFRRSHGDFAFWLYLSGLMAFWGGLTLMDAGGEWERFLYFIINLFVILLSVLLRKL
jgi:hypothetical protein